MTDYSAEYLRGLNNEELEGTICERDERIAEVATQYAKARTALSNVSGALVDSGVVVPAVEWRYGEAVRGIVAERDAAVARLKIATDALEILALRQDHVGQVAAQALGELKGGS